MFGGLLNTSCTTDPGYQEVSYGGTVYYYDIHGYYYRRDGNGYRPCPKPPGKPDRPPKPTHPIAKPPGGKPGKPVVLPAGSTPQTRPITQPSMPVPRPMPRPMPRATPSPRAR